VIEWASDWENDLSEWVSEWVMSESSLLVVVLVRVPWVYIIPDLDQFGFSSQSSRGWLHGGRLGLTGALQTHKPLITMATQTCQVQMNMLRNSHKLNENKYTIVVIETQRYPLSWLCCVGSYVISCHIVSLISCSITCARVSFIS